MGGDGGMKLPYHTLVIFPTLACNQKCPYCVNHYDGGPGLVSDLSGFKMELGGKWAKAMATSNAARFEFVGGEPGLHPEFADMVNAVPEGRDICVATNASERVVPNLLKIRPRKGVRVQASYHRTQTTAHTFASNMRRIVDAGFEAGCHAPDPPEPEEVETILAVSGLHLSSLDLITNHDGSSLEAFASTKPRGKPCTIECPVAVKICVAPNGDLYTCHMLLYSKSPAGIVGNLFVGWHVEADTITCPFYGWCHPCDINRFVDESYNLRSKKQ